MTMAKNVGPRAYEPPRGSTATLLQPDQQPITSRLGAGSGSARRELETVLDTAPPAASRSMYQSLVLQDNVTGKATAAGRTTIWRRLKERYVMEPTLPEFSAFANAVRGTSSDQDRGLLCYLMFARSDRLFREVTLASVVPNLDRPGATIDAAAVQFEVERRARDEGVHWTPTTITRIRRHILAALKDYGVLSGSATKCVERVRPGAVVIAFAARLAKLEGLTDYQLLESQWFQLLGLDREATIGALYAAAREGALGFRMQADVVEVTLPPLEQQA